MLPLETLLKLRRWNTPTIYNGWEQITRRPRTAGFNVDETRDFMPDFGPMVGYAVTVKIKPSEPAPDPDAWQKYRHYLASIPGPKIIVMQDMDHPAVVGSFWGEVGAVTHKALDCVGVIVDGAIRDIDEMRRTGFKALARRLCVGHAHAAPWSWGEPVQVFGTTVTPGDLIHADQHGFLVIPEEDQDRLLEAALFMDHNENETVIRAALAGCETQTLAERAACISAAGAEFAAAAHAAFGRPGEWK